jgi:hypothetical protein
MLRFFLSLIVCCFVATASSAQTDSTAVPAKDTAHSVKKAMIFSAVLPGSGQIYNHLAMPKGQKKAYWKVPLIYAGLGTATYFVISNNRLRRDLREEYDDRTKENKPPATFLEYDDAGLIQLHDMHRNRRDLSILALGVVYLLNVADAGVEAHFVHFDVGDDLSLSFQPVLLQNNTPGIGMRLNFH